MKIGVAMVVNNLDVGGLEKVVVSLLNHLDPAVFDLSLICLSQAGQMADEVHLPPGSRLVLDKQPGRRLPLVGLSVDPSLFMRIRRFVADRRIDVLHAHNLAPLLYAGIAARLLPTLRRRPRVVYSEHNQIYSASPGQRRRFRAYVRLADQVVAVSHDLRRTLTEEAGTPSDRVRVIHNGIDGDRFAPRNAAAGRDRVRRELGIPDGDFVVGTAVVLSEQKGITFLLDAARIVRDAAPGIRFVIAGDGPLRGSLEAQAHALGLGDRVVFLGYRRDVPALIAAFDAYVLPSLWEGLPLALIEALAIGRPVVCTRVGGNPEVIEHGVNGLVVSPRDATDLAQAIVQLYRDRPFAAATQRTNIEKFHRKFSLAAMIEGHAALYRQLAL